MRAPRNSPRSRVVRTSALTAAATTCAALAALASVSASCLVADPPALLPAQPVFAPTIDHSDVFPPTGTVLTVFPDRFVVPITRVDPTSAYEWEMYIDYDPTTGDGFVLPVPQSTTTASVIDVSPSAPTLAGCHVIELLVATSFSGTNQSRHSIVNGGDSVTWFYSPGGNLSGCPAYLDGGFDGAFPDAGSSDGGDAGEAGRE